MTTETKPNKIALFSSIRGFALFQSRLPIMFFLKENGWRVIVATVKDLYSERLHDLGFEVYYIPYTRGGAKPYKDWAAFQRLKKLYSEIEPSLVHSFQAKPVVMGNIALRKNKNVKVINTITGLGHAYTSSLFAQKYVSLFYYFAFKRADKVIFQNKDDADLFKSMKVVEPDKCITILGSGVDVAKFRPVKNKSEIEKHCIVFIGRLINEKGIREFIEAAQICKVSNSDMKFQVYGEFDLEHPESVEKKWFENQIEAGVIDYKGYVNNIDEVLPYITLLVLPSYREGLPRSIMEASACGAPSITTDVPGCRQAVIDQKTGILVPPRDAQAIAHAILKLINNQLKLDEMRKNAREYAVRCFSIDEIRDQYLTVYQSIGIEI